MLGDRDTRAGHDERGRGGEVERAHPPAAGPAGIHQPVAVQLHPHHGAAQRRARRRRPRPAVSPLARSPISSAAVSTGVASPRISTSNAAPAAFGRQRSALGELVEGLAQGGGVGHGGEGRRMGSECLENVPEESGLLSNGTRICATCRRVRARLDSGPMSRTFLATLHFDGYRLRRAGSASRRAGRSRSSSSGCWSGSSADPRWRTRRAAPTPECTPPDSASASRPRELDRQPRSTARSTPSFRHDCWVESVHAMQPGFHARKSAISVAATATTSDSTPPRHRPSAGGSSGRSAVRSTPRRSASAAAAPRGARLPWPSPSKRRAASRITAAALARSEWEPRPDGRGRELPRRGRPLPASHGAHAGRHHGGHRARTTPRWPTSSACWSGATTQETSPPAPPQGLYFVAAAYPARLHSTRTEEPVMRAPTRA